MNSYFILFPNCVAVKGANRSSICDLQENRIKLIPNLLFEILALLKDMAIKEIKNHYNNELNDGIDKYFEMLEKEGYGFWTDDPKQFPDLNLQWDSPSLITNAIIDIDERSVYSLLDAFRELSHLGVTGLQLRFYWKVDYSYLNQILNNLLESRIKSIDLVLKEDEWSFKKIKKLCLQHRRIRSLFIYCADIDNSNYHKDLDVVIACTKQIIHPETHCGVVSPDFFTINIKHFTESQKSNSCLNKKVSIDRFGIIKNCPSSKDAFGRFGETTLIEAIKNPLFSKYWNVSKDQIAVCQDCEFRFVCTDCRAFILDPENSLSKPSKCGYDPYSSSWV